MSQNASLRSLGSNPAGKAQPTYNQNSLKSGHFNQFGVL
jgi:hypothetical protein